jgi:diaminopropionate ammonia-lyase
VARQEHGSAAAAGFKLRLAVAAPLSQPGLVLDPYNFRLFANPRAGVPGTVVLPAGGFRRASAEITAWPDYAPTPLRDLPAIAAAAGVGVLRLKDEAERFGLGSFKALGGAYAVARLLIAELARRGVGPAASSADLRAGRYAETTRAITVTCATDGNHGRSVAWGAQRFGCWCVIFIHHTVSQARADAIARYGAELRREPGTYDDAVREAARVAAAEGWLLISDTSWPGYSSVPVLVMQGYRLIADEAADQWHGAPPTHVFVQGGVGGLAAAVSVHLRTRHAPAPRLVVVEPDRAACLLASAELGSPTAIPGDLDTVMAGLACGQPSLLAWAELERAAAAFMAVPDAAAIDCMKLLAGEGIVAGESGAAGLAGFLLAAADPAARAALGLGADSRVLLFNTEGATDPALYRRLVQG